MPRKVDNLLGLAILATVQERPMHRYEMATVIKERGKDHDMAVKWGSLYTVVQNLTRHGFLEVSGSERDGNRPERTIYAITDAGRAELRDWARDLVATPVEEQTLFIAGLSVLAALSPDEAVALLQLRSERLADLIAVRRAQLELDAETVQRLFLVEEEYRLTLLDAEAGWVRGLLTELTSGSFPELEAWRAFTDRLPALQGGTDTN